MDAKSAGNALMLVGVTTADLGGAHVTELAGGILHWRLGEIPLLDLQAGPANAKAVARAIRTSGVCSAHDLSEGGLLVAAAEMGFAGRLGIELDLAAVPGDAAHPMVTAFAEGLLGISSRLPRNMWMLWLRPWVMPPTLWWVAFTKTVFFEFPRWAWKRVWMHCGSVGSRAGLVRRPVDASHGDCDFRNQLRSRTGAAFEDAGASCQTVQLHSILDAPEALDGAELVGLPGGFAYGDAVAAGRIKAALMRERVVPVLSRLLDRGVPMIAPCNGFQTAVQCGLLPGPARPVPKWPSRRTSQGGSRIAGPAWISQTANAFGRRILSQKMGTNCPVLMARVDLLPVQKQSLAWWMNGRLRCGTKRISTAQTRPSRGSAIPLGCCWA